MTPSQPEQEYIITEKQLDELHIQCESRYFDEMVKAIRSRPAPAPDELASTLNFGDFEGNAMEWLKQQRSDAAAKARVDFAKAIFSHPPDCLQGEDPEGRGDDQYAWTQRTIERILQEARR